ncbi:MAG: hypothetical protein WD651_09560 [Acidimicrobiia bacterium]
MPTHPDADVSEVLTLQRIAAAFVTLSDPDRTDDNSRVQLHEDERHVIEKALQRSPHPLGGFARKVLDQWGHLDVDDQVAGLLLFAEIANQRHQRRTPHQEVGR